jgi:hypothetical protein
MKFEDFKKSRANNIADFATPVVSGGHWAEGQIPTIPQRQRWKLRGSSFTSPHDCQAFGVAVYEDVAHDGSWQRRHENKSIQQTAELSF